MNRLHRSIVLLILASSIGLTGCRDTTVEPAADENQPVETFDLEPLTMLVVDDDSVGEAIARQWSAREDGSVKIVNVTSSELSKSNYEIDAAIDVVVYPPGLIGEFVSRDQLMEMPKSVWNDTVFLNKKEMLAHSRSVQVKFGNKSYAVPLGSPYWVAMYRSDVLKQLGIKTPTTWEQFNALATVLNDLQSLENDKGEPLPTALVLPLADTWAAQTFIARSIPYVRFRGNLSTVFDRRSMEPLINSEAFVQSLNELKANAARESGKRLDPQATFLKMARGEAAVAITWPSSAFDDQASEGALIETIEIARLPGSKKIFQRDRNTWADRDAEESVHVSTVGFEGLVASIPKTSSHQLTAFEFVKWLPSKAISLSALSKSPRSGPFRATHLGAPIMVWTGDLIPPEAADQYAEIIREINEERVLFVFPRIPERDAYLSALDNAVSNCLSGKATAKEALDEAARKWSEITERSELGSQRRWLQQSNAY